MMQPPKDLSLTEGGKDLNYKHFRLSLNFVPLLPLLYLSSEMCWLVVAFPTFSVTCPLLITASLFNKSACWDCYTAVKLSHKKITRASQKETNTPLFSTISFRTTEAMQKWNLPSLYCISPGHTHRHKNHSLSFISSPFVKQSDRKSNPQRIGTEISPLWICCIGVVYWIWAHNRTQQ